MVCSDCPDVPERIPYVVKPARADAGREFIEGIRESLEDFSEGKYKVFKDADELLAYLFTP